MKMIKLLAGVLSFIALIGISGISYANYYPDALFAEVSGIASDDTLSVRVKPDWRSEKITALPPGAFVGVDQCAKLARSIWCKIHAVNRNLGQYNDFNELLPGWVNARYLRFSSKGYVEINGKNRSCEYATNCSAGKCNVVTQTSMQNGTVTAIKTQSYPRRLLKGIGELDIPGGRDGYPCGRLRFKIDDYLSRHSSNSLDAKDAKATAESFLEALKNKKLVKIKNFIHPLLGIVVTNKLTFGEADAKHFSQKSFAKFYRNGKQLNWGTDYAKGDPVKMSLKQLMDLRLAVSRVSKIKTLHNLKGFKALEKYKLKGYEFYWQGKGESADYNWRGADLILAKISGKWYVAGFLWNRWTI